MKRLETEIGSHRSKTARRTAKPPKGRPRPSRAGLPKNQYAAQASGSPTAELRKEISQLKQQLANSYQQIDNLANSLEEYVRLFDCAPIGYVVLDEQGLVKSINQHLIRLLKIKPLASTQFLFVSHVAKSSTQAFVDHFRSCRQTGQSQVEMTLRTTAGEHVPVVLISELFRERGHLLPPRIQIAVIDLRDRVIIEEKLAHTQRDYVELMNNIEGMVWEADASTFELTFVSRSAERFLGYPLERWYEPGFWEQRIHVDDRERVMNQIARSVAKGSRLAIDYRVFTADRKIKWIHHRMSIRERRGRVRICGVAVDISDRVSAEQELRQIQDLLETRVQERTARLQEMVAEMESFSYSLSHDMRAPLRSIQGYSHVLMNLFGDPIGPTGRDYLERVMSSAERLDSLIQDVLNYTKLSRAPVELANVDLEKIVDGILQDYNGFQWPKAEILVQKPLQTVIGHEAFLTQCISNLLSNAVKFVRQGETPRVIIRAESTESDVRLWVEDNGIGIAPKDYGRIFGIFQRLHPVSLYEGTGIGLAIVQRAADRMGGRVGVCSELGQGSKFWLQLRRPPVEEPNPIN